MLERIYITHVATYELTILLYQMSITHQDFANNLMASTYCGHLRNTYLYYVNGRRNSNNITYFPERESTQLGKNNINEC